MYSYLNVGYKIALLMDSFCIHVFVLRNNVQK